MSEENMSPAESAGEAPSNDNEGMGGGSSSSKVKTIIIAVVVLALAAVAFAMINRQSGSRAEEAGESTGAGENAVSPESAAVPAESAADASEQPKVAAPADQAVPTEGAVVTFTDAGYAPATITVKQGESVTFKNEGTAATWPASAMHPTHAVYPGSGIEKCGTDEQAGIFDACRGLNAGESWSFQFNEIGDWKYHDHLNPTKFGAIIVES